jgi:hypothetical protein
MILPRTILVAASLLALTVPAIAGDCDLQDSYVARLSERDHFNSNGQRLGSAAAIIRQDRANFHAFRMRDPEDQSDGFFSLKSNRALMERLLRNGSATPGVLSAIVNGTPLVLVEICTDNRVMVTINP